MAEDLNPVNREQIQLAVRAGFKVGASKLQELGNSASIAWAQ